MAPGKRSTARRKQNVEAAKKSYEQKKEERSSLQKKNQTLMDEQMTILHEMARLEEEARLWEDACNSILHTCERDFLLVTEQPTRDSDVDMTEEGEQLMDYTVERSEVTYQQEDDNQIALDLSLKTRRARRDSGALDSSETAPPPQRFEAPHTPHEESAPQRLEAHAPPQRYELSEIDYSTLDLGATQEVELKVQRNKKSKRVTFDESRNSVKNYKNDIFTPPICTTVH